MAAFAKIMRRQRVYLGDPRHGSHKGGTDGASRSHEIAILHRLPYKLLGYDIHHRIAVSDYGIKFSFKSCRNYFRKFLSVKFMRSFIAYSPKGLVRIRYDGRAFVGACGRDPLAHIRYHVRIFDHDLIRFVRAEI